MSEHSAKQDRSGAWIVVDGDLVSASGSGRLPDLRVTAVHAALREFILHDEFPCVGARSAMNRTSYQFGLYETLADDDSTERLARDLARFADELEPGDEFATFVASFLHPADADDRTFDELLWKQLQALHHSDDTPWPDEYAADPDDPHFAWSFRGIGFFVVGLSPQSTRLSRQFPFPTLVFNPHAQFEKLREEGTYERMQEVIRERDRRLQGDINPSLAEFGEESEARQYSGCPHASDWSAPFDPEKK